MSVTRGIELQLIAVVLLAALGTWYWTLRQVWAWRDRRSMAPPSWSPVSYAPAPTVSCDTESPLPWAGRALATPPNDLLTTIAFCHHRWGDVPFLFPLGWYQTSQGTADCAAAALQDDIYHILISGQSRIGKDNLALQILISLALTHPPSRVQYCIIDGKGLDLMGLASKAHTWRMAGDVGDIKPTMEALSRERERRGRILRQAEVSKWENYTGDDVPLLVCYISELSLLEDATSKAELTTWLNAELTAGAAFGMRYIVATQTASNFATRWRSQISLYLAGFQPSQTQDQPNTGLTTKELSAAGGIPPSALRPYPDGAGVFTAVHGREVETIRTGYLTDAARRKVLARLPDRDPSEAPATEETDRYEPLSPATPAQGSATEREETGLPDPLPGAAEQGGNPTESAPNGTSSRSSVAVSAAERAAILAAWEALQASGQMVSRRAICRQVFNGATGGSAYRKVQAVLDDVTE